MARAAANTAAVSATAIPVVAVVPLASVSVVLACIVSALRLSALLLLLRPTRASPMRALGGGAWRLPFATLEPVVALVPRPTARERSEPPLLAAVPS